MWLRPKRRNGGIIIGAQDQALNMHALSSEDHHEATD
jgi:hypothetical protein